MIHTVWSLSGEGVLIPLSVWVPASAVAVWLTRHRGRHPVLLFAAYVSVGLILSVTLFREGELAFSPRGLLHWSSSGWRRVSYDPFSDTEVLLNTALFVPAGLVWTLLTGRPVRVLAALSGLSLLIECVQAVTGLGANDVADLLANSAGAVLGVVAGKAVRRPRRPKRVMLAAVAGATLLVGSLFVGANHRQASLERELSDRFTGTDLATYTTWEADDRLYDQVFHAASVLADGARHRGGDDVQVRYPASFFGLSRCVFVEWTRDGATVRRGAGEECAVFMG
ncbi:VanZ family protein [Streptomyces sp. S6]